MPTPYIALVTFVLVMSALTLLSTMRRATRYGRYMKESQKGTVPALLGWLLFESPQLCAFAVAFWLSADEPSSVGVGLFVVWQAHYVHRAILYPIRMRSRHKRFPIGGIVAGVVFNTINGVLNGYAVAVSEHLSSTAWLVDPRFVVGAVVFVVGWSINFHSDSLLIGLRKDGFGGYRIPRGGMFRWVSCANYTGEIVMWCGWALATWTLAGFAFAVFTISNLLPRALSHHRWYQREFADYPPERKAVLPGLL